MGLGQSLVGVSTWALLSSPPGLTEGALVGELPELGLGPGSAACLLNASLGLSNLHSLFWKAGITIPAPQARGKGHGKGQIDGG